MLVLSIIANNKFINIIVNKFNIIANKFINIIAKFIIENIYCRCLHYLLQFVQFDCIKKEFAKN